MNSLPKLPTIHNGRGQAGQQSPTRTENRLILLKETIGIHGVNVAHWPPGHHKSCDTEPETNSK